jgi:hypothetical protein
MAKLDENHTDAPWQAGAEELSRHGLLCHGALDRGL